MKQRTDPLDQVVVYVLVKYTVGVVSFSTTDNHTKAMIQHV